MMPSQRIVRLPGVERGHNNTNLMDSDIDLESSWPLDPHSFASDHLSFSGSPDHPCPPLWAFSDAETDDDRVADYPYFLTYSDMSTVGMESKIKEVWRWVIDERIGMIGIHGEGGVGKTTLLKQIYNNLTIFPHCFDTVIWVTVSQTFSLPKVQDDIWKRIGVVNVEWVDKSSQDKAKAIHDALSKNKFVLLLDDLGEQLDLREVGVFKPEEQGESYQMLPVPVNSPDPGNKCKVIFTTRSLEVCREMGAQKLMSLDSLEWEYAWELFKKMVGEDKLCDPKFLELGQLIARTCKGLPMLLRTVGRAMASKTTYKEWEAAIKGINFQVAADGDKVFFPNLLNLCFQSLDRNTKSCLLFYSLFPEDFTILKNELIDFWICQELIGHGDSKKHDNVLNLGYNTVDALVGACLLEEEDFNNVKLLDLIRDFALKETKLRVRNMEVGWVLPMRNSIRNTTLVSESFFIFLLNYNPFVMVKGNDSIIKYGDKGDTSISMSVRSLWFKRFSRNDKKFLTVLDLSNSGVEEVPRDIAGLVSLEYLNLSHTWIEHLPVEIKKLVKLKCLNLEYDELLRVVPKQLISGLRNLQVLKLFRCGFSVEEMNDNMMSARYMDIEPIFCLKHLKVLSITITCPSALHKLFSSHKLLNSTQSLSLEVFWGVRSLDFSAVATMKNLLTLEIHRVEDLKELSGFSHSVGFVREKSFEKLREITFEKCSSLMELTWVVLVPNLTILTVKDCEEIEKIVSMRRLEEMFSRRDLELFTKLEILVLESLPKLNSIYGKALPFQQLKKIEVTDCDMLKKLPVNSTSAKLNKVIIEAEENWWNDIEWEDDVAKDIFFPCFKSVID